MWRPQKQNGLPCFPNFCRRSTCIDWKCKRSGRIVHAAINTQCTLIFGLALYYCRFIRVFSLLVRPSTDLIQAKVSWECRKSNKESSTVEGNTSFCTSDTPTQLLLEVRCHHWSEWCCNGRHPRAGFLKRPTSSHSPHGNSVIQKLGIQHTNESFSES